MVSVRRLHGRHGSPGARARVEGFHAIHEALAVPTSQRIQAAADCDQCMASALVLQGGQLQAVRTQPFRACFAIVRLRWR